MSKRARYGNYAFKDANGKLYARVQLRQADGRLKTYKKRAMNLTHVQQLAEEILAQYKQRGQAYIDGHGMTLERLADWYKTEYVIQPVYLDGVKIEGMRTWKSERLKIDRIVKIIGGSSLIHELDESSFRNFRKVRIGQGVTITTINRDFESIRAMMRKAKKKKWLNEVPDFDGFIQEGVGKSKNCDGNGRAGEMHPCCGSENTKFGTAFIPPNYIALGILELDQMNSIQLMTTIRTILRIQIPSMNLFVGAM
ncbi:MAG: hypothetical protein IPQ00_02790 [Chloracidobacterium sp.]|nr:hypothetical protein [Chloracidobacterium sp.]